MSVAISSIVYWADWPHASDTTFEIRAKSTQSWISAESEIVSANESRIVGTGTITALRPSLPSITLPATSAGLDNQTSRWTVTLHRVGRKEIVSTVLADFPLPISFEPSTTWAQIKIHKNGKQPLRDTSTYTKTETDYQINLKAGTLNDASELIKGRTKLSVAPASASDPIAVGDNDPRITNAGGVFNVKSYGAVCDRVGTTGTNDRAAVQAAIDAAEAVGGGTVLIPGQCLVGTTDASTYILTISKSVKIVGVSGLSGLYISADTPTTTSLFKVYTADITSSAVTFEDIWLAASTEIHSFTPFNGFSVSAAAGKNLIELDGTTGWGNIRRLHINRCHLGTTTNTVGNGYAITTNGATVNGIPSQSLIENSWIIGGVNLPDCGDTVVLDNIIFQGAHGIAISPVSGATTVVIDHLNFTGDSGISITGAVTNFSLTNSILEARTYSTGATGALMYFAPNEGYYALIENNSLNTWAVALHGVKLAAVEGTTLWIVMRNNVGTVQSGKALIEFSGLSSSAALLSQLNKEFSGSNRLYSPSTPDARLYPDNRRSVMPAAGVGDVGHTSQIGNARFIGATGIPVLMTLDNRDTAQYSQLQLLESGVASGGLIALGSAFADTARRNNLEIVNSLNGSVVVYTNNTRRANWNESGIYNNFKGANVASAATIVPTGNSFRITGTTNIDTISSTGIWAGTELTLIFDGVLTVNDGTGNLKLAGNFTTSADDVLRVYWDGTNWLEVSRSVN